jgi:hypothetical protein
MRKVSFRGVCEATAMPLIHWEGANNSSGGTAVAPVGSSHCAVVECREKQQAGRPLATRTIAAANTHPIPFTCMLILS